MDIDLIFKIAAIGIIVSILNQVLSRSGREEQATMTTLAGLIVVLMMIAKKIAELFDLVKSLQPNCLVNSRIGNGMGDYRSMGDNQIPDEYMEDLVESPTTLNDTWGFKYFDANWKFAQTLFRRLSLATFL